MDHDSYESFQIRSLIERSNSWILITDAKGTVQPRFSRFAARVFQISSVPQKPLAEVLLDNFAIDKATLERIQAALVNILGAEEIFFDAMRECLPNFLVHKKGAECELYWAPIVNHSDKVEGLSISISPRARVNTASGCPPDFNLRTEDIVMREIVQSNDLQPMEFLESLKQELAKVAESLITSAAPDAIESALSRIHTIKGNCAVAGFDSLKFKLHQLENCLLSSRELGATNRSATLQESLAEVSNLALVYSRLFGNIASKTGMSRAAYSSDIVVSILEHVRELLAAKQIDCAQTLIHECLVTVRTPYKLDQVLSPICDHAKALAVKFNKPAPHIHISPEQLRVKKDCIPLLRSVLGQLLTNSVKHGIESTSDRQKAGKPARATIAISMEQLTSGVLLVVRDDGRGLNLAKLRGMLTTTQIVEDERIAKAIFSLKITTQDFADETSGRGYGLQAVRDIVLSIGGSEPSIRFTSDLSPSGFRQFELNILFPHEALLD